MLSLHPSLLEFFPLGFPTLPPQSPLLPGIHTRRDMLVPSAVAPGRQYPFPFSTWRTLTLTVFFTFILIPSILLILLLHYPIWRISNQNKNFPITLKNPVESYTFFSLPQKIDFYLAIKISVQRFICILNSKLISCMSQLKNNSLK